VAALQLPDKLGAILLPDCTLFPHGALPLHIFEPRYCQMLRDAVEGDCLFCVGRLTGAEVPDIASCTSEIGTACLIRTSREQSDGRSNLLLHGLCRVRFTEWFPGKPYPFARITTIPSLALEEGPSSDEARRLREVVEAILLGFPDALVTKVQQLLDRTSDPGMMSDAISQQFVQNTTLRQSLLEELSIPKRIDLLIEHLRTLRSGDN
jgi:Lon protease-like protein